jgi:tetratricopeptide (TPR) repeat protein
MTTTAATSSPRGAPPHGPFVRWQGYFGAMRKRPWLAGTVLVACLALIGTAGWFVVYPELAARHHLRQARNAADEYDLELARTHLEACLRHWPENGEAHFQLARTCRRAGNFPAARQHLQEAKRYGWDTDDIDLEYRLINAQTGAVRFAEEGLLEYLGTGHRDEVYVLETLVQAYLDSNFIDDAHRLAQYWIERYPDQWRPQLLRGMILERGQKLTMAIEQYEKLLAWKPEQPEANNQLARILLRAQRYDEAFAHFETYRKAHPDDVDALVGAARCVRHTRSAEAALPMIDQALTKNPDHAEANLVRGQILLNDLNKPAEALAPLRKADALMPNELEIVGAVAKALRILKRDDEAKPYEAKSHTMEREYRRLDTLIRQIIATDQEKHSKPEAKAKNVELRYEAGKCLMDLGKYEDGLIWLQSALQENPNHEPSRRAVQDYLTKAGKSMGGESKPAPATQRPKVN